MKTLVEEQAAAAITNVKYRYISLNLALRLHGLLVYRRIQHNVGIAWYYSASRDFECLKGRYSRTSNPQHFIREYERYCLLDHFLTIVPQYIEELSKTWDAHGARLLVDVLDTVRATARDVVEFNTENVSPISCLSCRCINFLHSST